MWINIEQLENLRAISMNGSITAASEELGRAKSALHYSIKNLEEQIGFRVLDTKGYRGQLTEKGRQLLISSEKFLKEFDSLKEDIHRIASGVESKISLSATALYSLKKLNRNVLQLQKQFPNTEIVFHREILSGERMLSKELVDMAIFEYANENKNFEAVLVDEVKLQLVISFEHPFLELSRSERTAENLMSYPQIIQRSTLPNDESHGVYKGSKQWTVSDLASKREIILDGLGWGRLPLHEIEEDLENRRLYSLSEIEDPIDVPLYIARRKGSDPGVVSQAFWKAMTTG